MEGFTPLHWAVLSDNPKAVVACCPCGSVWKVPGGKLMEAVIWLLKNGADNDAKDAQGRTAEDLIEDP